LLPEVPALRNELGKQCCGRRGPNVRNGSTSGNALNQIEIFGPPAEAGTRPIHQIESRIAPGAVKARARFPAAASGRLRQASTQDAGKSNAAIAAAGIPFRWPLHFRSPRVPLLGEGAARLRGPGAREGRGPGSTPGVSGVTWCRFSSSAAVGCEARCS
jgi:hypothetical protein